MMMKFNTDCEEFYALLPTWADEAMKTEDYPTKRFDHILVPCFVSDGRDPWPSHMEVYDNGWAMIVVGFVQMKSWIGENRASAIRDAYWKAHYHHKQLIEDNVF